MQKLIISEIFESIQGEGSTIGFPAVFIRTYGCNLQCPNCDTSYSYGDSDYTELTPTQVVNRVMKSNTHGLVITGGEPTIQWGLLYKVFRTLVDKRWLSLFIIESNGLIPIQNTLRSTMESFAVRYVVSPKFYKKDSYNMDSLIKIFRMHRQQAELKILFEGRREIYEALSIEKRLIEQGTQLLNPIIFQPLIPPGMMYDEEVPDWLESVYSNYNKYRAEFITPTRFIVQQHKWIWGQNKRGV